MKKLLLAPALAALLFTSCKDDPELEAPQINSIEFSKERIAVGQLITITPAVTDGDTDEASLTYEWKSTDGFSSDEKEAQWVPSETGEQTITLSVNDGDATTTQEATVDVVEPDFRLGLWGDSEADILASEENAGNEAVVDEGVLLYQGDKDIAVDAYILENDVLTEAVTLYFPEYQPAEYNNFITDYEAQKEELTDTYGEPVEEYTEWASTEAEATYANHPEQWGQAIAAGELFLASAWLTSETTGVALILQEDGAGGILYGLSYFQLEDGRYANELRKRTNLSDLSSFPDKAKNIKSLLK